MENLLRLAEYIQNEIDDIENQIANLQTPKKPYTIKPRLNPMQEYTDAEFRKRFRLTKRSVNYLHSLIGEDLEPKTSRDGFTLSAIDNILITLRYYASASFHLVSADFYGVSESTVCRIVPIVTDKIASLSQRFIHMPVTNDELAQKKREFFRIAGMPGIIGAIDGTLVKIHIYNQERTNLDRNQNATPTENRTTSNQSVTRNFPSLGLNSLNDVLSGNDASTSNQERSNLDPNQNSAPMENNDGLFEGDHYYSDGSIPPEDRVPFDNTIERQLRAQEEEENEANLNRRLLVPPNEIRRRKKTTVEKLREKQEQLVDLQIDLHQILINNAKIAQEESNEKLLLARVLRMNAEQLSNTHETNEISIESQKDE